LYIEDKELEARVKQIRENTEELVAESEYCYCIYLLFNDG